MKEQRAKKKSKTTKRTRTYERPVSLFGLSLEDAMKALARAKPAPKTAKKR